MTLNGIKARGSVAVSGTAAKVTQTAGSAVGVDGLAVASSARHPGGGWMNGVSRKAKSSKGRGKKKRPTKKKKLKTKRPPLPGMKIFQGNRCKNRKGAKSMNLTALHIKATTKYSGRFPSKKQPGAHGWLHDEQQG